MFQFRIPGANFYHKNHDHLSFKVMEYKNGHEGKLVAFRIKIFVSAMFEMKGSSNIVI